MLAGVKVTGSGFSQMAGWTELRELDLTSAPVSDEGMQHIGKMAAFERLILSYSDITDEGLGAPGEAARTWRHSGPARCGCEGRRHA